MMERYGIMLCGDTARFKDGTEVPCGVFCELAANLGQGSRVWRRLFGLAGCDPETTWLVGVYNILLAVFSKDSTQVDLSSGAMELEEPEEAAPLTKRRRQSGVRQIAPNKTQYGTAVPTSRLVELLGDHIPR